jgi:hypothetical protein
MKKKLIIFCVFASLCCGMYPLVQKCRELYYVHVVGLSKTTTELSDESAIVYIQVGYALLFIDILDQFGFIYFTRCEYGRADYVFSLNQKDGSKIEHKGQLTIWRYLPWQGESSKHGVYAKDKFIPYFKLYDGNRLFFNQGPIKRVAIAKLSELEHGQFKTNGVNWCTVVIPDA